MATENQTPAVQATGVPKAATAPSRPKPLAGVRTFLRNRTALAGVTITLFFVLVALLAPVIAPGDPGKFVGRANQPPSAAHIFGTDGQGKDVFNLTVWGSRISLTVAFGTALLATFLAILIGMSAGYFRGRVDDLLTLLTNLFLVIPSLPLLIVVSAYLKPGTSTVILVLGCTGWAFGARVLRAQMLTLREKDFVAAAKVSGEGSSYIIFREILPNMASMIFGNLISSAVYAIGAATALSFLGLTSVSDVTWGTNLFWAQNNAAILRGTWWTFLPSGLCVATVAFGLSLITYAMDEITNPRLRAERELSNVLKKIGLRRTRATPVVLRAH